MKKIQKKEVIVHMSDKKTNHIFIIKQKKLCIMIIAIVIDIMVIVIVATLSLRPLRIFIILRMIIVIVLSLCIIIILVTIIGQLLIVHGETRTKGRYMSCTQFSRTHIISR